MRNHTCATSVREVSHNPATFGNMPSYTQRIKCIYVEYVARDSRTLVSLKSIPFLTRINSHLSASCVTKNFSSQARSEDITASIQGKSQTSVRCVARHSYNLVILRNTTRFTRGRNHLCVMPVARNSLNLVTLQSIIALTRRKTHTSVEFVTNGSHGLIVWTYTYWPTQEIDQSYDQLKTHCTFWKA